MCGTPSTRPISIEYTRPSASHLYAHTPTHVHAHQTIALMAKDPAVSSIEVDCLQRADMLLPESNDSSLGAHDTTSDLYEVGRKLSVQVGAPWGIDRIDTNGRPIDNNYDDGDLTGKGVRVYIVDSGVQGSHDDFGGRVVNGHTVRAHHSRRIGRTRRSALVPDDRLWRGMGGEVNGRRVAVHLHAGLTSKEESLLRLRAPTCLDLPTHGALSQFGFFVWVLLRCNCVHTLLVSYSSRVIAVLSDLA